MGLLLVLESNKVAVLIIQEIESVVEGHFQVELRVREATFAHNVFARKTAVMEALHFYLKKN